MTMKLEFATYLLDGCYSLMTLPCDGRSGIYIFTFTDGTSYIATSDDLRGSANEKIRDFGQSDKMHDLIISELKFAPLDNEHYFTLAKDATITQCGIRQMRMRNTSSPNAHGKLLDFNERQIAASAMCPIEFTECMTT